MDAQELKLFKAQAQAELNRLEADSTAKEVAGKAIGKHGLAYITAIVVIGVGASIVLRVQNCRRDGLAWRCAYRPNLYAQWYCWRKSQTRET